MLPQTVNVILSIRMRRICRPAAETGHLGNWSTNHQDFGNLSDREYGKLCLVAWSHESSEYIRSLKLRGNER